MQHNRHRTKNSRKLHLLLSVPLNTIRYSITAYILYHIGLTTYNVTTAVAASSPHYSSPVSTAKNPLHIAPTPHSAPTKFPTDFKNTPTPSSFPSN